MEDLKDLNLDPNEFKKTFGELYFKYTCINAFIVLLAISSVVGIFILARSVLGFEAFVSYSIATSWTFVLLFVQSYYNAKFEHYRNLLKERHDNLKMIKG